MSKDFTRYPLLDEIYSEFLVKEKSAEFISKVSQQYTLPTLERIAVGGRKISRRAAVLAIGFLGDIDSNSILGNALVDPDRAVRMLADHGIRQMWFRVGNVGIESALWRLFRMNQQHRFAGAVDLATDLIAQAPNVAESWNQRAIALYNLDDFSHALCDCRRTIELNPFHFLAALGSANSYLELGDVVEALKDFRLALDINPDLEMVRCQINHLQRIVEGR